MPPQESTKAATLPLESTPLLNVGNSTAPPLPTTALHNASVDEEDLTASILPPPFAHKRLSETPWLIWRNELSGLVNLAFPVIGTYLLEMLPGLVSIILVGHIHDTSQIEEYIDATSLAVMFMNLAGVSIGFGLSTALDTLCSQAYGAQETHRIGTYLQTGVLVLSGFLVMVTLLFYNCTNILVALGQPPLVAELAGQFTIYLLPGVPFLFFYELLRKVLQAQNVAKPMLFVSIVANITNCGFGYYFVYHTEWGWLGAALARTICNMSFLLCLLPYVIGSGLAKSFWTGIHVTEAIQGIPQFLALGIPGMLQLCFEWWAFECLALLCGLLPNAVVSIGANAVILNVAKYGLHVLFGFIH